MSNRNEFNEFLMFNLKELGHIVPDESDRAYALLTTMAAGGSEMSESFYDGYISQVDIDSKILLDWLSYLAGMDCFVVYCDCQQHDCELLGVTNSVAFEMGRSELTSNSERYNAIKHQINALKENLSLV